jgi:hypothetical protein
MVKLFWTKVYLTISSQLMNVLRFNGDKFFDWTHEENSVDPWSILIFFQKSRNEVFDQWWSFILVMYYLVILVYHDQILEKPCLLVYAGKPKFISRIT